MMIAFDHETIGYKLIKKSYNQNIFLAILKHFVFVHNKDWSIFLNYIYYSKSKLQKYFVEKQPRETIREKRRNKEERSAISSGRLVKIRKCLDQILFPFRAKKTADSSEHSSVRSMYLH